MLKSNTWIRKLCQRVGHEFRLVASLGPIHEFRGVRAFLLTEESARGVHVPAICVTKMLRTNVHVNSDAREETNSRAKEK